MTVVDANFFLRALVQPATPQDQAMAQTAKTLFWLVQAGRETFTTSDAVIAEVVFILSSKRHYGVPRVDVAALIKPILQLPGCRLPHKGRCLSALDLWVVRPNLSFVDALGAIHAQELRCPLASFDADLAKTPGVVVWQPPASDGTP